MVMIRETRKGDFYQRKATKCVASIKVVWKMWKLYDNGNVTWFSKKMGGNTCCLASWFRLLARKRWWSKVSHGDFQ